MREGDGAPPPRRPLDVLCGRCPSNQFRARLVPGQEEAGRVQRQRHEGLLGDNGGSRQAVPCCPSHT